MVEAEGVNGWETNYIGYEILKMLLSQKRHQLKFALSASALVCLILTSEDKLSLPSAFSFSFCSSACLLLLFYSVSLRLFPALSIIVEIYGRLSASPP